MFVCLQAVTQYLTICISFELKYDDDVLVDMGGRARAIHIYIVRYLTTVTN